MLINFSLFVLSPLEKDATFIIHLTTLCVLHAACFVLRQPHAIDTTMTVTTVIKITISCEKGRYGARSGTR